MKSNQPVCLLLKAHVETYTRKDGTVVDAHERKGGPLKHGERVKIKPEFQDPGDDKFDWRVDGDEEKGRLDVVPHGTGMHILPKLTVQSHMVDRHDDRSSVDAKPAGDGKDWRDETNWHSRQQAKMKTHSEAELHYIVKDATEAAEIAEKKHGGMTDKAGKYRDEAHYAAMELNKRNAPVKAAKKLRDAGK